MPPATDGIVSTDVFAVPVQHVIASDKPAGASSERPKPHVRTQAEREEDERVPWFVLLTTYFGFLVLIVFGNIRDFFGRCLYPDAFLHLRKQNVRPPFCIFSIAVTNGHRAMHRCLGTLTASSRADCTSAAATAGAVPSPAFLAATSPCLSAKATTTT